MKNLYFSISAFKLNESFMIWLPCIVRRLVEPGRSGLASYIVNFDDVLYRYLPDRLSDGLIRVSDFF